MFKIVRYERARILDWGDLVGKTSKTVDDPIFSLEGRRGLSKLACAILPVVKP